MVDKQMVENPDYRGKYRLENKDKTNSKARILRLKNDLKKLDTFRIVTRTKPGTTPEERSLQRKLEIRLKKRRSKNKDKENARLRARHPKIKDINNAKKRNHRSENKEKVINQEGAYRCKHRDAINDRQNKAIAELKDNYVKSTMTGLFGTKIQDITPEMIKLKRNQLLLYRINKKIKRRIKNGIISETT